MATILQPNGIIYTKLLRFTLVIPTLQTVRKFDFNSRYNLDYSYYIDTFIRTYHPILWANIPKPNLDDIGKYLKRNTYHMKKSFGEIFSDIAVSGKKSCFSYIYSLYNENNVKFKFNDNLFDLLSNSYQRFGIAFMRWILRERPKSIIITLSGIEKLITNKFPCKYIRSIILDCQKYNIINRNSKSSEVFNIREQLINMALKTYHCNMINGDLSYLNYKELSFYLRLVLPIEGRYLLIWTLNGGNKKQIDLIERLISDNIDVKPYSCYYCWEWYNSSLPYKFIEDR